MVVLTAMLKLIAGLALGFAFRRMKILNESSTAAMSSLTLNAACPCLIFSSIVTMSSDQKGDVGTLMIVGVFIYIFLAVVGVIAARLLAGKNKGLFYMILSLILFGQVGFMGFPLAEAFCGDLGVSYMGILNIHFTVFMFTIGIYLCSKSAGKTGRFDLKKMINSSTIGIVVAVIIFMLDIEVPDVILAPIQFIGQLMSPLAMIIVGSTVAAYPFKKLFSNWKYYVIAILRLAVLPALSFLILHALYGTSPLTIISTISIGVPPAATVTMMAISYGGDSETASLASGLTTVLSIVTIPVLWIFMNAL